VIVDTPDAVFVSDIENSREVKKIVTRLKEAGRHEHHHHPKVYHPWGSLTLLEEGFSHSVVRREIYPGKACTIAANEKGKRGLTVIKGVGNLKMAGSYQALNPGDVVPLPLEVETQIVNSGDEAFESVESLIERR
jgi:mannose-6-phosphate isomerase-like protein (cupin superfamily)